MREVDLWTLVQTPGYIDEGEVLPAMRRTLAEEPEPDYRTRLLIHEALMCLQERMGRTETHERLSGIEVELLDNFERECDRGFSSLRGRIVKAVTPQVILQMLQDLGRHIRQPTSIDVGGSCSLILNRLLVRQTDDLDIVDELPEAIRTQPLLVDELARRYGLRPTHFQSHYVPTGWRLRRRSVGRFGSLDVFTIDPIDVVTGKFFSRRTKDMDDLVALWPKLDTEAVRQRLADSTTDLRKVAGLEEEAVARWKILTREESLP